MGSSSVPGLAGFSAVPPASIRHPSREFPSRRPDGLLAARCYPLVAYSARKAGSLLASASGPSAGRPTCHCEPKRSNPHRVAHCDGDCRVASLLAMTEPQWLLTVTKTLSAPLALRRGMRKVDEDLDRHRLALATPKAVPQRQLPMRGIGVHQSRGHLDASSVVVHAQRQQPRRATRPAA